MDRTIGDTMSLSKWSIDSTTLKENRSGIKGGDSLKNLTVSRGWIEEARNISRERGEKESWRTTYVTHTRTSAQPCMADGPNEGCISSRLFARWQICQWTLGRRRGESTLPGMSLPLYSPRPVDHPSRLDALYRFQVPWRELSTWKNHQGDISLDRLWVGKS